MIKNPHRNNIDKQKESLNDFYNEVNSKYKDWVKQTERHIVFISKKYISNGGIDDSIKDVTIILNDYINYCSGIQNNYLSPNSNFVPSILEEFFIIMFSKALNLIDQKDNLKCASETCIIDECWLNPIDKIKKKETKNIDCAIYTNTDNGSIPIVGLEIKTYADKTMFTTISNTFEHLRRYSPYTKYISITEFEARVDEDIRLYDMRGIQYYCLRGQHRSNAPERGRYRDKCNPVKSDTISNIYCNVIDHVMRCYKNVKV